MLGKRCRTFPAIYRGKTMQVFSKLQKGAALAAAGVVSVVALPARAASSVDLTPITSSISASDITTGVMAKGRAYQRRCSEISKRNLSPVFLF
ncbi:hypothetical protein [Herbaspirillum rubrisubalbicans]|uniref:hypothetical protein n=1 Tax=Herbaspirillum rubrisubalbicans TaxID=80842 RepID=UPI0015C53082|nr:hypothetical protein [Herbaspirillum rubrisubalbicans]